jgi:hypothetical protein
VSNYFQEPGAPKVKVAGTLLAAAVVAISAVAPAAQVPTVRSILAASGSTDIRLLPSECQNTPVVPKAQERYIQVACHINPSAEVLFVFSRDAQLKGEVYGWALATLPNDLIVYHDSEVHFAATHSLGISVFDPATGSDKKIYPPVPYSPVRTAFIARVAEAYKARGEAWFRVHNHSGDPESFDSNLQGPVNTDERRKSISFTVRYGDPDNANDPLPFTKLVRVICSPIDSLTQLRCRESPQ